MQADGKQHVTINSDFLSIVAHDLRNPIQLLKLNADILKKEIRTNGPADRLITRVDNIWCICDSMGRLVNSILDAFDANSAGLPIKKQSVNIADLIAEIANQYSLLSNLNGTIIKLNITKCYGTIVECDPDRLQQVIGNLLDNAMGHCDKSYGIDVLLERKEKTIRASVTNRSLNSSAYNCPLLFEKGFSFDAKTFRSRGLGLFISRLIIEAHGGRIWADVSDNFFQVFFEIPV